MGTCVRPTGKGGRGSGDGPSFLEELFVDGVELGSVLMVFGHKENFVGGGGKVFLKEFGVGVDVDGGEREGGATPRT